MFPSKVTRTPVSTGSIEKEITTGVLHYLHIIITGIVGGTVAERNAAAGLILESMALDLTRSRAGNASLDLIEDLNADFFRRRSNHIGGFCSPLDGAQIFVGMQNLAGLNEKLLFEADWADFQESEVAADVDVSSAKVLVLRSQSFENMARHDYGPGEVPQYVGVDIIKTPYKIPDELDGATREMYYVGSLDDYTESELDVNGESKEVLKEYSRQVSAARYRHEDEGNVPLLQLFDADRSHAGSIRPELKVTATGGQIAQVGITTL